MSEGAPRWHGVRRALASEEFRDYVPDYIKALRENLRDAQARQARTSLLIAVAVGAFTLLLGSKIDEIRIAGLKITDLRLPTTLLPAVIAYLAYEGWFTLRYIRDARLLLSEVVAGAFRELETYDLVDALKPWNGAFVTDLSELQVASSFHPWRVRWLRLLHTLTLGAFMVGTPTFVAYCYWLLLDRADYGGPLLVASAVVAASYLMRIVLVWGLANPADVEHAATVVHRHAPGDYSDFSDDAVEGVLEVMANNAMLEIMVEPHGESRWRAVIYDPLLSSPNSMRILRETNGSDRRAATMALLRRLERDGWRRRDGAALLAALLSDAPSAEDRDRDDEPSRWNLGRRADAMRLRRLNDHLAELEATAQNLRDEFAARGEDIATGNRSRSRRSGPPRGGVPRIGLNVTSLRDVGPKLSRLPWRRSRERMKLRVRLAEHALAEDRLEVRHLKRLLDESLDQDPVVEPD